jgi:hypothetical protein
VRGNEHTLVTLDTARGHKLERIQLELVHARRRVVPLVLRDRNVGESWRDGNLKSV